MSACFFWNQKRRYGQILEPAQLWGRTPKVFSALALLYGALDRKKSPIEPSLRSLITVRVSQLNWCEFCVDINSMMVLRRGNSQKKLNDLENFQDRDKLKQHFDENAIIELTALIAFQNMSSKFNAALDVPAQGFCQTRPTDTEQDL